MSLQAEAGIQVREPSTASRLGGLRLSRQADSQVPAPQAKRWQPSFEDLSISNR